MSALKTKLPAPGLDVELIGTRVRTAARCDEAYWIKTHDPTFDPLALEE